jgi:hypothetical protein
MIKRICKEQTKPFDQNNEQGEQRTRSITNTTTTRTLSTSPTQSTRHRKTSHKQGLQQRCAPKNTAQNITSTSVANDTYGTACRGALCVFGKSTFQFQDLLLESKDGNCHGCRKLVLVHLP